MRWAHNIGMTTRRMLVAALAMLLVGCQSVSPGWRDSVSASMDDSLSQARAGKDGKAVPSDVNRALLPPIEIALSQGGVVPLEPRFDLTVNNAPARQVFMGLVEGTPYSMILPQDVHGTISLNLKEVTVPEALGAIRDVYGYEYRREGNRFFILGNEMQTRLFNVNYLNLIRKGKSDTRVSSGNTSSGTGGAGAAAAGGSLNNSQVETASQSDFWKDIQTTLAALVGVEGGRKVIVNSQTGIIAVRAMPDELRLVEDYLGATHATVNRQVVLEAKIIQVDLSDGFQSGINWAKVSGNYTFGQTGGSTMLGKPSNVGPSDINGNIGSLNQGGNNLLGAVAGTNTGSAVTTPNISAFGGIFSLAVKTGSFAAFLELLQSQGEVQVLSSPRVSTVNNQKALIKVGTDSFFVKNFSVSQGTTTTTSVSSSTLTPELQSFFSGIALDVTPQIDEAGNILLHIHPAVTAVTEENKTFKDLLAKDSTTVVPLAISAVQESDNIVRAQSGQIIVIGGLLKEGSTEENVSVPFLGDIPLVGNLFKHKKVTRIKKELVILLKPTIITTGQDWSDAAGESQERIKKIRIGS